jgi:hypothetical protein
MARKTGHGLSLPVEPGDEIAVDPAGHPDHRPSDVLLRLGIRREFELFFRAHRIFDVTVIAFHAEGASEGSHGGDQLIVGDVGRKDFEIVELQVVRGARGLRFLLADRSASGCENDGDDGRGPNDM